MVTRAILFVEGTLSGEGLPCPVRVDDRQFFLVQRPLTQEEWDEAKDTFAKDSLQACCASLMAGEVEFEGHIGWLIVKWWNPLHWLAWWWLSE